MRNKLGGLLGLFGKRRSYCTNPQARDGLMEIRKRVFLLEAGFDRCCPHPAVPHPRIGPWLRWG